MDLKTLTYMLVLLIVSLSTPVFLNDLIEVNTDSSSNNNAKKTGKTETVLGNTAVTSGTKWQFRGYC